MLNKLDIIQSNLFDLKELFFHMENFDADESFYLKVLILYYQGDIKELQEHVDTEDHGEILNLMAKIRLDIIKQAVKVKDLDKLKVFLEMDNKFIAKEWSAEAWFLLGWANREIQNYQEAKDIFKATYSKLWKIGAKKKAVKSMMNHAVCQSHIDPSKRYIIDFQHITKKAIEVGDPIVAGLCQLNLARDYRFLGSYGLSEKLINQAILNLENDRGANNYYYAILERCNLYIELNRLKQAHIDYQIIAESPLKEIQEAAKLILKQLGGEIEIDKKALDPVWMDVLKEREHKSKYKLTNNETELVKFLALGDKSKLDIIDFLYGNKLNFESAENRFKVLLSRLRKKAPHLITYSHGFYTIKEGITLIKDEIQAS